MGEAPSSRTAQCAASLLAVARLRLVRRCLRGGSLGHQIGGREGEVSGGHPLWSPGPTTCFAYLAGKHTGHWSLSASHWM